MTHSLFVVKQSIYISLLLYTASQPLYIILYTTKGVVHFTLKINEWLYQNNQASFLLVAHCVVNQIRYWLPITGAITGLHISWLPCINVVATDYMLFLLLHLSFCDYPSLVVCFPYSSSSVRDWTWMYVHARAWSIAYQAHFTKCGPYSIVRLHCIIIQCNRAILPCMTL